MRAGDSAHSPQEHFTLRCYVVDPRGRILAEASEDGDELVVADLDLDMVREVRNLWQFFRDRRSEMYGDLNGDLSVSSLS